MLFSNLTESNDTVVQQSYVLLVVLSSVLTTLFCCVFLFINITMLVTLRSREVFKETPRYVLLSNLLFADTVQLAHTQTAFLLSACSVTMLPSVCAAVISLYSLTQQVSLVTLVIMCLERYVAVCHPLRHCAIISIRNTKLAICVIWAFIFLNVVMQIITVIRFFSRGQPLEKMSDYCGKESIFLDPVSELYDEASTYFLFVLGGVTVTFSYTGIIVAAHSASTSRSSASRARNTLLLHLVQLVLNMSSTIHNSLNVAISQNLSQTVAVQIQFFLYISLSILPKCLSCLIYGLRDQNIRPVLVLNLTCQCRGSSLIFVQRIRIRVQNVK